MDCTWNECYKTKTKETTNVSLLRSYQKFLQTTTSAQKTRVTITTGFSFQLFATLATGLKGQCEFSRLITERIKQNQCNTAICSKRLTGKFGLKPYQELTSHSTCVITVL